MKIVAKGLKDQKFNKHIEDMQLALFKDNKLNKNDREDIFKHLAKCKRCRDVLKVASEIAQNEKPINNIDYMGYLKPFIPFIAGVVIFFGVPVLDNSINVSFKSVEVKKNILDRSLDYWEEKFLDLGHQNGVNP